MKTLKTLLLALLISSLNIACKKDKTNQPTQIGANKMYAKVNGVPWEPKGCIACNSAFSISYGDRINFGVEGKNIDQKITISIILRNLTSTGTYELTSTEFNFGDLVNTTITYNRFTTTKLNKGNITITKLDLVNKIISGTFEFTAEDKDNPQNTVKVTDGWFDGKYEF